MRDEMQIYTKRGRFYIQFNFYFKEFLLIFIPFLLCKNFYELNTHIMKLIVVFNKEL